MPTNISTMNRIMTEFFEDVDFTNEGREYLLPIAQKLCENDTFLSVKAQYEKGDLTKESLIEAVDKISDETGIHNYTVQLLTLISFTDRLKKLYKQNGYDMQMYKNTIADLHYKALESFEVKGVWGTFVADWQYKFFELGRFTFGRLQVELYPVPEQYQYMTASENALKIHIPRSGKPLTPESIDDALQSAKVFFKDFLKDPIPVVCASYLLYTKFAPLYPDGSNLQKFINRFKIVSETEDEAGSYPNMWRLFDMDYTGNIDDYPEKSRLHRAFKQYLKDGGRTGVALGLFFI